MIPNYETSETQRRKDRMVVYKNEEWLPQLEKKTGVADAGRRDSAPFQ